MRLLCFLVVLAGVSGARGADEPGAPASGEAALFGDLPVVEAAALHAQTLAEAPASVTVITAADIRKFGYRTLGDVLAGARGFTVSTNHLLQSAGVRGFAVPGDISTCFVVMINGHAMAEIAGESNAFDGAFGLDLDVVDRIEIVRGPSSALYGSNGILATINIVTKSPVDSPRLMVSTETGGGGPQKMTLMSSQDLGRGANLLVEGSGFLGGGHSLFLPGFDTPGQNYGVANQVDRQSGYHGFVNLAWGAWNFSAMLSSELEQAPILSGATVFDDPGQFIRVARNFVGAAYTRDFGGGAQLRWQLYYDQFRYGNRYDYPEDFGILDNRDSVRGDWISSQLTYSRPVPRIGLLTVGLSGKIELRNLVENSNYSPAQALNLRISQPDRTVAPFVQQEWNLARNWKAYLGARLDSSYNYGSFVSPRLALVYQPGARSSYKIVYGRPFRSPSVYEQYYQDGITQVANPHLRPENAIAVELSAEHKIGKSAYALVDAYHYSIHSVIEETFLSATVGQYQNTGERESNGMEFELGGHLAPWLETTASLSLNRAEETDQHARLANAPARIAKLRAAVPLFGERVYCSADFQYLSARTTGAGAITRPVALVNATLSTARLVRGLDLVAGIRNALNWGYNDPGTWPLDASIDEIPANGRTAFVKLIWRQKE